MTFYSMSFLCVVILNLSIAIFVLYKNPFKNLNRVFFLFGLSIATWGLGGFLLAISQDRLYALRSLFVLNLGQVFIYSTFYHFVLLLTKIQRKFNKILLYLSYISSFVFLFVDRLFGLVNKDVIKIFDFYYPVGGIFAYPFTLVFISFIIYSLYLLYKAYKYTRSYLEKNRYLFIFLGMGLALLGAIPNFLLVLGINIYPSAHICSLILNFTLGYSIVKHQLMDIKIILRRGLIYTILTLFITLIWLINILFIEKIFRYLIGYETFLSSIITISVIIFLYIPLRDGIQYIVDRFFFKGTYIKEKIYERITTEIAKTMEKDIFLPKILDTINEKFHIKNGLIMLFEEKENLYKTICYFGRDVLNPYFKEDDKIILWLKENKREILREETEDKGLLEALLKIKGALVIPLIFENEMLGLLSFDEKLSGLPYNYNEIGFLNSISKELSLAINNLKLYNSLKKRTIELEEANRAKSDFLSLISHEFRTPLTVIIGYLYLFREKKLGEINEKQREGLKIMDEKANRLKVLINDLLNLAMLEKGKKIIRHKEKIDIIKALNETIEYMSTLASNKNIEIIKTLPQNVIINSNYDMIKKVFANLLDNAIKFNVNGGKIMFKIEDKENFVECSIKDTGIGIEISQKEKIFERFYQIDSSERRIYEGTGLGLSIVKEILEEIGGKIWVLSELGVGSEFIFSIPK